MKKSVVAGVLSLITLGACSSPNAPQTGQLSFRAVIDSPFQVMVIPPETRSFRLEMMGLRPRERFSRTVERKGTASTVSHVFKAVPVGPKKVRVQALSEDGDVLAEGEGNTLILPFRRAKLEIELQEKDPLKDPDIVNPIETIRPLFSLPETFPQIPAELSYKVRLTAEGLDTPYEAEGVLTLDKRSFELPEIQAGKARLELLLSLKVEEQVFPGEPLVKEFDIKTDQSELTLTSEEVISIFKKQLTPLLGVITDPQPFIPLLLNLSPEEIEKTIPLLPENIQKQILSNPIFKMILERKQAASSE